MIAYQYWLGLDSATRNKLVEQFHLPANGGTEVMDGRVIRDRVGPEGVLALTCERLCAFAEVETKDIYVALEATIKKLNDVQPKEETKADEGAEVAGVEVVAPAVAGKAKASRGNKKGESKG